MASNPAFLCTFAPVESRGTPDIMSPAELDKDLPVPGAALQLVTAGGAEETFEFETLQSEQTFEPGFYWTAKAECDGVEKGETLLLLDINMFEGQPHSVKLRYHPRDGEGHHTIMVAKFMASFEPCPNADEIRQREQQAVMQEVTDLQNELMRTQMDPQLMIAAVRDDVERKIKESEAKAVATPREAEESAERQRNLSKTHRRAARRSEAAGNPLTVPRAALASDVGDLIGAGINETGVAEMRKLAGRQAIIAGAQAAWLQKKTSAITTTLGKLAPYIAERSAVALARASGAVKMSERIKRGIASLDLYTGKDVDAYDIRTGADAPSSEPLTIIQGKRYAEEEFAAWADVTSDFDFTNKKQFFDAIASNDELMAQVLPTPRCVVSVAMTRNARDYGDPLANMVYNIQNALVFLLVRNGNNVHVVYSKSPSHEAAKRLFPTKDELQRPFVGIDGARISIRDTEFGEATKWFDDIALVYRRFLILLCGLDHRLQLFGSFYPPEKAMSFMTAEFQESFMRFLADDEGTDWLIGDQLPDLSAWMTERNKMAQSGSRIFVLGRSAAIKDHAPELKRRHALDVTREQFKAPSSRSARAIAFSSASMPRTPTQAAAARSK
jgi:hypothetical protein